MIYLIGGVSRSGKSSARKHLLDTFKISGIETDSLRTTLEISMPELGIHHKNTPSTNAILMRPYVEAFIQSRSFFNDDFVIEGDCITPATARKFANTQDIKTVFIGYPKTTVNHKFNQLSQKHEGWTAKLPEQEFKRIIDIFIKDSIILQAACHNYNLPFIDSSDMTIETIVGLTCAKLGL